MSGDVQPRKRKEKRRKKDDLGVEEPRGTAATFGEGDVLMHSHHEHGTGGHWCAKIIFFSLLAVLVTLIGLIILENRGLSELEANAVESRYSGVLEGWIEDAPDDHHDEHTLELKHHRYEDNQDDGDDEELGELENEDKVYHEDDTPDNSEHDDDTEHEIDEEQDNEEHEDDDDEEHDNDEDYEDDGDSDDHEDEDTTENVFEIADQDDEDVSNEQNVEDDNEDDETMEYNKYYKYKEHNDEEDDEDFESNDSQEEENENDSKENDEGYDDNKSNEIIEDNDDNNFSYENDIEDNTENYYNKNSELSEEDEEDLEEEIERIEKEFMDEVEEDTSREELDIDRDVNNNKDNTVKDIGETQEIENEEIANTLESDEVIEATIVEQMTMPSGKPFVELEDEPSTEKPADTLAEEEEYEKRQEQIRLEKQESSSQMWMKLMVGGALLVATHAVIRRFTAPRDSPEAEDNTIHEDDPSLIDRRMTLIPKESVPLLPQDCFEQVQVEPDETVVEHLKTVHSDTTYKREEEQVDKHEELVRREVTSPRKDVLDQELYSDDDDEEIDEEYEIERKVKEYSKDTEAKVEKDADQSETEEVPDDVEIIDDEQIDEEIEEEDEDEEEISDVDDAELLSRLEAKYGRLPEPERSGYSHKDGGNNIEDEWPGEPSEEYWRQQLDFAEEEIRQGEWAAASARLSGDELAGSARAQWLAARALDAEAEQRRDNKLLTRAISSYLQLLKKNEQLSDKKLLQVTNRVLNRIQFRGNYLSAEPVYRILIRRFPDDVSYRNNLTVSFLMANRADLAGDVLKETLKLWPSDRVALAHYGFVLKTQYNKLEESVKLFHKALENDTGPACEPRFYYHLGDALLLLGRFDEAQEVHRRGATNGHFLSPAQRSLYNVKRLKSRPWWRIEDTPYVKLARALEKSWKDILKEGEAARALYEKEKEGLKEKGEWSQLDIFVRGQEISGRCKRAPVTCSVVKSELAAAYCRRGQIKFSSMEPGTHVRPHVGPTNCRLRMHLGLSNTKDTYIRVDQETRQWQLGKVLLFDDSFEHEVWHNGTGTRLVLIVDVWHPDLTLTERRQLPAI